MPRPEPKYFTIFSSFRVEDTNFNIQKINTEHIYEHDGYGFVRGDKRFFDLLTECDMTLICQMSPIQLNDYVRRMEQLYIEESKEENEALKEENEALKEENKTLKEWNESIRAERINLSDIIDHLRFKVAETTSLAQKREKEIKTLKREIDWLLQGNEGLKWDNDRLEKENKTLKEEIKTLKSALSKFENENDELREELAIFRHEALRNAEETAKEDKKLMSLALEVCNAIDQGGCRLDDETKEAYDDLWAYRDEVYGSEEEAPEQESVTPTEAWENFTFQIQTNSIRDAIYNEAVGMVTSQVKIKYNGWVVRDDEGNMVDSGMGKPSKEMVQKHYANGIAIGFDLQDKNEDYFVDTTFDGTDWIVESIS